MQLPAEPEPAPSGRPVEVAPDEGPHDIPVRTLDAGPGPDADACSDSDRLSRLRQAMLAVRAAADPDEVVVSLLDLASGLVESDAATLELRGAAGVHVPWVVAYRGLRTEDQAELADPAWRETGPSRFGHRLALDLTGEGARPGRLTLWRAEQPFDPEEQARAELAATSIETLLHQFLRRMKGEQRQQWTDTAEVFADALVAPEPTPDVLQLVVDQVRTAAGCDLAWLVIGTPASSVLRVLSGRTLGETAQHKTAVPTTLSTQVLASCEPLRVTDLARAVSHYSSQVSTMVRGLGPALVQPVQIEGRCVGALGLAWSADRAASYLSLEPGLPEPFAARAALAMRIGLARTDAQRLAVLEERHRIRMDLHDRVIQRLYALGMSLEAARLRDDRVLVHELLNHAVERVDDTIAEIRRTISGLSVVETGTNLHQSIVDTLDRVAMTAPFRPELKVRGLTSVSVPPALAEDLLSVLEEAVSNVVRHAEASRCRVLLDVDGHVELVVEDDGVGVPDRVHRSGLDNLRHRAEAHDGQLVLVGLHPGTRLTWTVPNAEPPRRA